MQRQIPVLVGTSAAHLINPEYASIVNRRFFMLNTLISLLSIAALGTRPLSKGGLTFHSGTLIAPLLVHEYVDIFLVFVSISNIG